MWISTPTPTSTTISTSADQTLNFTWISTSTSISTSADQTLNCTCISAMEVATVKPLHKQATTPAVHMGWKNPRPRKGTAHATSVVNKMHKSQTSQKITNSKIVSPIKKHRRKALHTEVCISCSFNANGSELVMGYRSIPGLQQHREMVTQYSSGWWTAGLGGHSGPWGDWSVVLR